MWEAADLSFWQTQDASWMKIKRLHIDSRFLFQNPLDPIYIGRLFFSKQKLVPGKLTQLKVAHVQSASFATLWRELGVDKFWVQKRQAFVWKVPPTQLSRKGKTTLGCPQFWDSSPVVCSTSNLTNSPDFLYYDINFSCTSLSKHFEWQHWSFFRSLRSHHWGPLRTPFPSAPKI